MYVFCVCLRTNKLKKYVEATRRSKKNQKWSSPPRREVEANSDSCIKVDESRALNLKGVFHSRTSLPVL